MPKEGSHHYFEQHTLQPTAKSFNEAKVISRILLDRGEKVFQISYWGRNSNRNMVEITKQGPDFQIDEHTGLILFE